VLVDFDAVGAIFNDGRRAFLKAGRGSDAGAPVIATGTGGKVLVLDRFDTLELTAGGTSTSSSLSNPVELSMLVFAGTKFFLVVLDRSVKLKLKLSVSFYSFW